MRLLRILFVALLAAPALGQGTESAVELRTPTGTIHGSLLVPAVAGRLPVVLIVAGSGPTDRDGNQPRLLNDSLKQLAQGLAAEGIATLRYDKRGVASSRPAGPAEQDLRFGQYVDDAARWIEFLRLDGRFHPVAVAGHSEGATIGALAAAKTQAAAFVSIAGMARRAPEILRTQLRPRLPQQFWEESERILAALERGETTADVPKELMIIYRPSVQPYLISWFRQSPVEAVAKLAVPVLVVQGTADIQVAVGEGEALRAAARNAEYFAVPGMSHALKAATEDPATQMKGLTDPTVPIDARLAPRIASFVRAASPR